MVVVVGEAVVGAALLCFARRVYPSASASIPIRNGTMTHEYRIKTRMIISHCCFHGCFGK